MGKLYKVKVDGETFLVEIEEVLERPSVKSIEKIEQDKKPAKLIEPEKKEVAALQKKEQASISRDVKTAGEALNNLKAANAILAPLPGKVVRVNANPGIEVKRGDLLLVIEAMKMENEILSTRDGKIKEVFVKAGDTVDTNAKLLVFED